MLEDRKFYYPIEGKEPYQRMREGYDRLVASPWKTVLGSTAVHTASDFRSQPIIMLRGVIAQPRFSIAQFAEYSVRVTYRGKKLIVGFGDAESVEAATPLNVLPETNVWTTRTVLVKAFVAHDDASFMMQSTEGTEIAAVSLMPADNIEGFRRDTIELLK
jgi:alpha-N-arabinofuranosidase